MSRRWLAVVPVLVMVALLIGNGLAVQGAGSALYPWPDRWSPANLASWSQPLLASGSALPAVNVASMGDLFLLTATPTQPVLHWRASASWQIVGVAAAGGGGTGTADLAVEVLATTTLPATGGYASHTLLTLVDPAASSTLQTYLLLPGATSTTETTPAQITATMTADNAPSPNVVSVSQEAASAYPHFDGEIADVSCVKAAGVDYWIKFDLGTGNSGTPTSYRLYDSGQSAYNGTRISSWTFEASNDGSSWTVLDTRNNYSWTVDESGHWYSFPFSNTTAYRFVRFVVKKIEGGLDEGSFYTFEFVVLGETSETVYAPWWVPFSAPPAGSGAMPIASGGTGQTASTAALLALGGLRNDVAVDVASGGTSATSAAGARTAFGISNHNLVSVDGSGNVGVGTSTPLGKLHVAGGDIHLNSINDGTPRMTLQGNSADGKGHIYTSYADYPLLLNENDGMVAVGTTTADATFKVAASSNPTGKYLVEAINLDETAGDSYAGLFKGGALATAATILSVEDTSGNPGLRVAGNRMTSFRTAAVSAIGNTLSMPPGLTNATFSAVLVDTYGCWDSSYTFTAPIQGVYQVSFSATVDNPNSNRIRVYAVCSAGTFHICGMTGPSVSDEGIGGSQLVPLSSGGTVSIQVAVDGASPVVFYTPRIGVALVSTY